MSKKFATQALATLRAQGYAVVAIPPENLNGTLADDLESELYEITDRLLESQGLVRVSAAGEQEEVFDGND